MRQLAAAIGVDARSISAYEHGEWVPEAEKLHSIATKLGFPPQFFYEDDLEVPAAESASFRALSKMSAAQRDTALTSGAVALMVNAWIERKFELPPPDVPDLSVGDPEAAAEAVRHQWGLGDKPIKNMIHLLEARGVRVFSLSIDSREVDAFSMWQGDCPFVFLNTQKSGEHSRFDAAHELGHLVLHRHGAPQGQEAEREANAFASAFLMPRSSVFSYIRRALITVDDLIKLKRIWNVSVAALAYRLHKLDVLTDWHYRSIFVDLGTRGFRRHEPEGSRRETSQVLSKVFSSIRADGLTKSDIAMELCITPDEIEQVIFGLATTGLTAQSGGARATSDRRAKLHVIKQSG